MKIFITGGTGFIGQHILREICIEPNEVLLLRNRSEIRLPMAKLSAEVKGDLNDLAGIKDAVKQFDPEVCIHCAWSGIPDFSGPVCRQNLENSLDLLSFMLNETNCRKIVASGSCFEYGKKKGVCRESDRVETRSFFAWAKQSLYHYASLLAAEKQAALVWLRLFYVYGPGQRSGSLIPSLAEAMLVGRKPAIKNILNANDYIEVGDVARAFALAAEREAPSGIYNIGSGKSTRVIDICRMVEKAARGTAAISDELLRESRSEQEDDFRADISKAGKLLGWRPEIAIEEGIRQMISRNKGGIK